MEKNKIPKNKDIEELVEELTEKEKELKIINDQRKKFRQSIKFQTQVEEKTMENTHIEEISDEEREIINKKVDNVFKRREAQFADEERRNVILKAIAKIEQEDNQEEK